MTQVHKKGVIVIGPSELASSRENLFRRSFVMPAKPLLIVPEQKPHVPRTIVRADGSPTAPPVPPAHLAPELELLRKAEEKRRRRRERNARHAKK
jgi:hypothetical protein